MLLLAATDCGFPKQALHDRLVGPPGLGPFGPDVAYVGVPPEHRGNGYADDLLLEASHLLAEAGATEIEAATDVGNAPMAAAFARCGYVVVDRLMVHV